MLTLTSRSLQGSGGGVRHSQNGDETVQCGPRARLVGLSESGTGAQGETWGMEKLKGKEFNTWAQEEAE